MEGSVKKGTEQCLTHVVFDQLEIGRIAQSVVVRLMHFWEARNPKKGGQLMGLELLLIDEKSNILQSFIGVNNITRFKENLRENRVYLISSFEVTKSNNRFRISDHKFMIRFTEKTTLVEVGESVCTIIKEKFRLREFAELLALANKNEELPDVVGRVCVVQGSNMKDAESSERIVVRLQLKDGDFVRVTIWEERASAFRFKVLQSNKNPSIMLVTSINPKIVGGQLYLNTTSATRFFFEGEVYATTNFSNGFGENKQNPEVIDHIAPATFKMENVSINELNNLISKSYERDMDFMCKAKIIDVLSQSGWNYIACTKCSRKVGRSENSFVCNYCHNTNATGVVRYRVEVVVDDGNDVATFVIFDRDAMKLTNTRAADIVTHGGSGECSSDIPSCLREIIGKMINFQVKVSRFNFTNRHQSFTVSRIVEDNADYKTEARVKEANVSSSTDVVSFEKGQESSDTHTCEIVGHKEKKQRLED